MSKKNLSPVKPPLGSEAEVTLATRDKVPWDGVPQMKQS